jgi:hypothetical protein
VLYAPPVSLFLIWLITRTLFGEQYISLSFSLCSLIHSPVTSLSQFSISSSIPSSRTPSDYIPSLVWEIKPHTRKKKKKKPAGKS